MQPLLVRQGRSRREHATLRHEHEWIRHDRAHDPRSRELKKLVSGPNTHSENRGGRKRVEQPDKLSSASHLHLALGHRATSMSDLQRVGTS